MKAVNLLPSDQRAAKAVKSSSAPTSAAPAGGAFGAYALLGALALAVVFAAALVLTSNQIKDKESELARVAAERQAVEAKVAALKPYGDFQQLATQRVSTVVSLASSRFDWDRVLADISRALPADVRLKTLNGSVTGKTGAAAPAAGAKAPSPTVEIAGCTISQEGTARLMARMRAVRGVTRVSLGKSDKDTLTPAPADASGNAAPTGVGDKAVGLCGRGARASFDLVLHFERATLAPGAGNSIPQTAAAAAATPAPGTAQGQAAAAGQPAAPGAAPGTAPNAAAPPAGTQPAQPGTSATTPVNQGTSK